ncbi:MAG: Glycosyl transferase, group 1 [Candidatus Gottesmanbacteria bacterium GW2011_GWA1_43_11]|uniref:Glycosyl transferase, group 1 n=1 Tax=Candidatus Gottesmanbacteria bacterium GW2011_GWA1_43_11 TaxID=1618436 RepID=A0A0G1CG37_9BACT|nr:MAG: Glycosyl transferase, group 1 [Candidatus Gottesmanbacteria bacterium GW2011_GWA1_43_11]
MNIGIDGFPLSISFPCGTLHYAQNLITELALLDKKNNYFIFSSKPIVIPNQSNFKLVPLPNLLPVFRRHLFLNNAVHDHHVDVFHYLLPHGSVFLKHNNIITTIHDLQLQKIYGNSMPLQKCYSYLNQRFAINNSKTFISVSQTIKLEIEDLLSKSGRKLPVHQIYNGVGNDFKKYKKRKRDNKFFLCFADFSPRKNLERILIAFTQLSKSYPQKIKLVIIVSTLKSLINAKKTLKALTINNRVRIIKNAPQTKLVQLYNQSVGFLYPSLYEGFGLPILEAMACGCPVITSNYGAMKEVAGVSALLVDPYSPTSLTLAMKELLVDKELSKKLGQKGIEHAKKFNWKITARRTLDVYEKTCSA